MGFNLSCDANDNWKTCTWKRIPRVSGAKCEFKYTYLEEKNKWTFKKGLCDSTIESQAIDGSKGYRNGDKNHICQLRFVSANFAHEGNWICMLESCQLPKDGGCRAEKGSGIFAEATIDVKVPIKSSSIKNK